MEQFVIQSVEVAPKVQHCFAFRSKKADGSFAARFLFSRPENCVQRTKLKFAAAGDVGLSALWGTLAAAAGQNRRTAAATPSQTSARGHLTAGANFGLPVPKG